VADDEFKNLTTYMRDLHEYYMAESTETYQMGFEVIIRHPLVFHYPLEEKHFVGSECLFQLYQRRNLDTQILTLWTMYVLYMHDIIVNYSLDTPIVTFEHFP